MQAREDRPGAPRFVLWRRGAMLGPAGLAVSILVASCGDAATTAATTPGARDTVSTSTTTGAAAVPASKGIVISTSQSARGSILVSGNSLYTLRPSQMACTAECLKIWPAVLLPPGITAATPGRGVSASKLGTMAAAGRGLQVTYAGQALYWFSGDTAPGQVNGNVTDQWGTWSVVVAAGPTEVSSSPASGAKTPTTTRAGHTSLTPTTSRAPTTTSRAPTTTSRAPTTTSRAPTTTAPTPTTTVPAPTTTAPPATTTTTAPSSGGGAF